MGLVFLCSSLGNDEPDPDERHTRGESAQNSEVPWPKPKGAYSYKKERFFRIILDYWLFFFKNLRFSSFFIVF